MNLNLRPLLTSLLFILSASSAFGSSLLNAQLSGQRPKKDTRIWSGFANVSGFTGLYDFQDGSRRDGFSYTGRINFKTGRSSNINIQSGYSTSVQLPERNDFMDTTVAWQQMPTPVSDALYVGYRLGVGLPSSKDSRIRQNLQMSSSASLIMMVNSTYLPSKRMSLFLTSSVGKNFHEYDTDINGNVNMAYSANQSASIAYGLTDRLSFSFNATYRARWSYQNVLREAFDLSQELSYAVAKNFSIAGGHSNSGSLLAANGQDSNVQLMNENTSVVYFSGTYIF